MKEEETRNKRRAPREGASPFYRKEETRLNQRIAIILHVK